MSAENENKKIMESGEAVKPSETQTLKTAEDVGQSAARADHSTAHGANANHGAARADHNTAHAANANHGAAQADHSTAHAANANHGAAHADHSTADGPRADGHPRARSHSEREPHFVVGSADDFREPHTKLWLTLAGIAAAVVVIIILYMTVFRNMDFGSSENNEGGNNGDGASVTAVTEAGNEDAGEDGLTSDETEDEAPASFAPHAVESTQPSNMIASTAIEINGEEMANIENYQSGAEISFEKGSDYTQAEGIFTFRGDNFRNSPVVGTADVTKNTITQEWSQETGATSYKGASWTGSGWTGQPLMRKWTRDEKAHMNMEDWAKDDDDLVEVIYATMDGNIYFLDLKTGKQTRQPMYIGWTFKGAGALDPRGYPILYLGAGYNSDLGPSHAFIINLVDCTIMYEFGAGDEFSIRSNVGFFDSSPLVDVETDTLIWPGENGVIYLIHLNSNWDASAGTMSIEPGNIVKWRYQGIRTGLTYYDKYWVGIEDSFAAYKGYLFAADNGGHLMCLDLNTLQLVWVQDTLDDTNSTPVLSTENGHLYLYIGPSFHLGWRSSGTAPVPIMKIDAETGEIVWQKDYECYTMDGVSGGLQSTVVVGENDLKGYVYATMSMTGESLGGVCVCLDCETGEVVWEQKAYYAWSSPILVYNKDGSGRLLYCTCAGTMYMLDPKTGKELATSTLSDGAIEASPAAWDNYVVIGIRACKIWGLKLE